MPSKPNPDKKEAEHSIKTIKLEKVKIGPNGKKDNKDTKLATKAPDTTKPVQVPLKDI